jgi:hypothetical protein
MGEAMNARDFYKGLTAFGVTKALPTGEIFAARYGLGQYGGAQDETASFQYLCGLANTQNKTLILPASPFLITQSAAYPNMRGTPGKSQIILGTNFTYSGFNNQFALINPNFAQSYSSATADKIRLRDFDIVMNTSNGSSMLGIGNASSARIDNVHTVVNTIGGPNKIAITSISGGTTTTIVSTAHGLGTGTTVVVENVTGTIAGAVNGKVGVTTDANTVTLKINTSTLTGSGGTIAKPSKCDACIDLYAAVKDVRIEDSYLENYSQASGGGLIWVRNFCNITSNNATTIDGFATEGVEISGTTMKQTTADEAISVFGCNGASRAVRIHHNFIYGLGTMPDGTPTAQTHQTLVSAFPLVQNSSAYAAVYDVEFGNNYINDKAFLTEVMRFGNTTDGTATCQNIRSLSNTIHATLQTTASTSSIIRNITNSGSFSNTWSGNSSEGDSVIAEGSTQLSQGINGFSKVIGPSTAGNLYTGLSNCTHVTGGTVEAFGRAFYNCQYVSTVTYRILGTTNAWEADSSASASHYAMRGCTGSGGGGLASVDAGLNTGSSVEFNGNTHTTTASSGGMVTNANSGARVRVANNSFFGPAGMTKAANAFTGAYAANIVDGANNDWFGSVS